MKIYVDVINVKISRKVNILFLSRMETVTPSYGPNRLCSDLDVIVGISAQCEWLVGWFTEKRETDGHTWF